MERARAARRYRLSRQRRTTFLTFRVSGFTYRPQIRPIRTPLHFSLLYHRPVRIPTVLLTLLLLVPLYNGGPSMLTVLCVFKVLLSATLITVNHRRSPNHAEFFLNMRQSLPVLMVTYLAIDLALYLLLAIVTLWVR